MSNKTATYVRPPRVCANVGQYAHLPGKIRRASFYFDFILRLATRVTLTRVDVQTTPRGAQASDPIEKREAFRQYLAQSHAADTLSRGAGTADDAGTLTLSMHASRCVALQTVLDDMYNDGLPPGDPLHFVRYRLGTLTYGASPGILQTNAIPSTCVSCFPAIAEEYVYISRLETEAKALRDEHAALVAQLDELQRNAPPVTEASEAVTQLKEKIQQGIDRNVARC